MLALGNSLFGHLLLIGDGLGDDSLLGGDLLIEELLGGVNPLHEEVLVSQELKHLIELLVLLRVVVVHQLDLLSELGLLIDGQLCQLLSEYGGLLVDEGHICDGLLLHVSDDGVDHLLELGDSGLESVL